MTLLNEEFQTVWHINPSNWFFLTDTNPTNALMFTIAKKTIYKDRLYANAPNINCLKALLKNEADIEYASPKLAHTVDNFKEKWEGYGAFEQKTTS